MFQMTCYLVNKDIRAIAHPDCQDDLRGGKDDIIVIEAGTEDKKTPNNIMIFKGVSELSELENMKLTFKPTECQSVSDKMKKFKNLEGGDKCELGSGRCATHNCKLVRKSVNKKMSIVDKKGTSWD